MKKILIAGAVSMVLAACGSNPQPVVQQAPQPQMVVVQNPDPMSGILTGMAIGYLMSNGQRYDGHNGYQDSHYRGPTQNITINKTYVTKEMKVVGPAPATAPAVSPKPAATQAQKDAVKAQYGQKREQKGFSMVKKLAPAPPTVHAVRPSSGGSAFRTSSFRRK